MGWEEGDSYGGRKGVTGLRSLLLGGLLERPRSLVPLVKPLSAAGSHKALGTRMEQEP